MPVHESNVPFQGHVSLLQSFITHREPIVERIQGVLNAQQKPTPFHQDRALLARLFEDCFFALTGITPDQSSLRGQLQQAHWDEGFQPRDMPGVPNEMFDPADMMARAFNVWRHTRWPGRNSRLRYAQTLFNLYIVRCLALLAMRVCDAVGAGARLALVQSVLDELWRSSPLDQPVLVRDVRWLVPVAQSPTTDQLAPYFEAARRFEASLDLPDRLEIHQASVLMAGGHLRSQLRHFTMQGRSLDEKSLALSTRRSNALDCAMTIQHLAPLLEAYEQAIGSGNANRRHELANVICQGISPDPQLFVNRLDLLGAYSMIEHLFVSTADADNVALTAAGQHHIELVQKYVTLMARLAVPLLEDYPSFRPVSGSYSPYGVMYGFSSNILEHMTLKALQPEAPTRFSLEDVFIGMGNGAEKLDWVSGWRRMPHVPAQVVKLYEYPQQFAEEIFARIGVALRSRAHDAAQTGSTGSLVVVSGAMPRSDAGRAPLAEPPAQYLFSSDPNVVASGKAQSCEQDRLLGDRQEGMYLVSYRTPGGWVALSKDVLTEVLGTGREVQIFELPDDAARVLQLLYPGLV
jgi:hypothetical protein